MLITFRLAEEHGLNAQILITVVAGLFILPFFLFSSTAGQIADKYEKSFLIRVIKFVEIVLMVLTAVAFHYVNLWGLVVLLFFMGAQSTFFGPLKFSILPQHLKDDELVAGNGLVSAGTYIAILSGTLCGGLFILSAHGREYISAGVVGVSVLGYAASMYIPKAEAPAPDMKIDWNAFRSTWGILSYVMPNKPVFGSVLGISWFWFLGAVFLAQFPTFSKDILGGNEQVSTLFLVIFSVGVGFGSTLCNRLLHGRVSGRLVPLACIGISASTVLLYIFSMFAVKYDVLVGAIDFVAAPSSWGIMLGLFLLAASGGIFSVPMYAIMQSKSSDEHRARVVACLNILDSFGMVLSAVFTAVMLMFNISIINIFLIIGGINLLLTPLLSRLAGVESGS
ncbi:MAG: MFS transporter [Synergistaceae bacterium]|nr:MFS transporter [Synergistaceae bacterium]